MIACCNDGTRLVIFKIERADIPETDEERAARAAGLHERRGGRLHRLTRQSPSRTVDRLTHGGFSPLRHKGQRKGRSKVPSRIKMCRYSLTFAGAGFSS